MITELNYTEIMKNQDEILELLQSVKREGIGDLIQYLKDSSYFQDPASSNQHGNFKGGLALHSLIVYKNLKEFRDKGFFEASDESLILIGLLHDICKVGTYKVGSRNVKDESGKWISVAFYAYNKDGNPYGHGEKSVDMIRDYITLSKEEKLAIRFHMGAYDGEKTWGTLGEAQELYPIVMFAHVADMMASRYQA